MRQIISISRAISVNSIAAIDDRSMQVALALASGLSSRLSNITGWSAQPTLLAALAAITGPTLIADVNMRDTLPSGWCFLNAAGNLVPFSIRGASGSLTASMRSLGGTSVMPTSPNRQKWPFPTDAVISASLRGLPVVDQASLITSTVAALAPGSLQGITDEEYLRVISPYKGQGICWSVGQAAGAAALPYLTMASDINYQALPFLASDVTEQAARGPYIVFLNEYYDLDLLNTNAVNGSPEPAYLVVPSEWSTSTGTEIPVSAAIPASLTNCSISTANGMVVNSQATVLPVNSISGYQSRQSTIGSSVEGPNATIFSATIRTTVQASPQIFNPAGISNF